MALAVSRRHFVAVFGFDSMSMYVDFVVYEVEIGEVFVSREYSVFICVFRCTNSQ
jgi:hypothetical protein